MFPPTQAHGVMHLPKTTMQLKEIAQESIVYNGVQLEIFQPLIFSTVKNMTQKKAANVVVNIDDDITSLEEVWFSNPKPIEHRRILRNH